MCLCVGRLRGYEKAQQLGVLPLLVWRGTDLNIPRHLPDITNWCLSLDSDYVRHTWPLILATGMSLERSSVNDGNLSQ